MREWAAKNFSVSHPRQIDVNRVEGLAGNFLLSVDPRLGPPNNFQSLLFTHSLYLASWISTLPMRLTAAASIFASLSQNFWNSGASRYAIGVSIFSMAVLNSAELTVCLTASRS